MSRIVPLPANAARAVEATRKFLRKQKVPLKPFETEVNRFSLYLSRTMPSDDDARFFALQMISTKGPKFVRTHGTISVLPEGQISALLLIRAVGCDYLEGARANGSTVEALRSRLRRAEASLAR